MAGSVNKVIIVGNVGKDPEIRFMPDGTKIANFSVATSEVWKDKNTGERRDKTEWHRISVLNDRIAEIVEKFVRKGSRLYIEGQLQTRKWTDQSGAERYTTEVLIGRFRGELTLLDTRAGNADDVHGQDDMGYSAGSNHSKGPELSTAPLGAPAAISGLDDQIPF